MFTTSIFSFLHGILVLVSTYRYTVINADGSECLVDSVFVDSLFEVCTGYQWLLT